jgi:NADP-dependent 3-hydroxy acid dehydrogenase YdfG
MFVMTHTAVAQGPDAAIDPQINHQAAESDPLRDEGEAYRRKLDEAGVAVTATRYTGSSKVAIVTGASSGIGLEVAKTLIATGYRVVTNSRNITAAMTLQSTGDLKLVDGDISLQETAQRVVATALRDFGSIDLLVNNAGVFIPKPFTEYTADDFRRATATNLSGFFYVLDSCDLPDWDPHATLEPG